MDNIDLHIHTSASNCFKTFDTPSNEINKKIIQKSKEKNLHIIACTDHYSVKNFAELKILGQESGITVIPGLEFSIKTHLPEKVSLVALFKEDLDSETIEKEILNKLNIPHEHYGNGKFLIEKNISDILSLIKKNEGILISTHQDKNESRRSFILKLIESGIYLFDLRYPDKKDDFIREFNNNKIIPLTFSDAHNLDDIGKYYMSLKLGSRSFNAIKEYFQI